MTKPENSPQNNDLKNEILREAIPNALHNTGVITTQETVDYIEKGIISKNLAEKGFVAGRTFKSLGILGERVNRLLTIKDFLDARKEKGLAYAIQKEAVGAALAKVFPPLGIIWTQTYDKWSKALPGIAKEIGSFSSGTTVGRGGVLINKESGTLIMPAGNNPNAPTPSLADDPYEKEIKEWGERQKDPNMTESQQSEYLKHDPQATRMNYDPSMMTEGQQAQYLKDHFNDPNMTEDEQFEKLKKVFGTINEGRQTREALENFITRREGKVTGEIISNAASFYNPTVQEFIEKWPNVKGVIASYEQRIWGKKDDGLMPKQQGITGIASQPFNRQQSFSTPNAKAIDKVLYGSVRLAEDYAIGYARGTVKDKLYGKDLKKLDGKYQKYKGYYDAGTTAMKTLAPNKWKAASTAVRTFANAAWQSIAKTAFGQAIGSAVTWAGAQLAAMWGAITSIPVIGGAIAAAGAAVSWAVGVAIGFLFAW
ncbi:MAG: hypothetical protein A2Y25_09870 [Candidatus Melainabacteria bacterium GWF2_37_15]|nr:MAG: hypothetical protein A2Y25_09870 [Candidatus Melainabacteria bacterium GWF2_37_15]